MGKLGNVLKEIENDLKNQIKINLEPANHDKTILSRHVLSEMKRTLALVELGNCIKNPKQDQIRLMKLKKQNA